MRKQAASMSMTEETIFYSWQSDLPETKATVRWALDRAAKALNREGDVAEAVRVDEATDKVAGWPDIATTILDKIAGCGVFVADLTPINGPEADARLTPNPNVMFELGYALGTGAGRMRIVCVVNKSYLPDGDLKELPFDVRGARPVTFTLEDPDQRGATRGTEDPVRTDTRNALARDLERAIREALQAVEYDQQQRILDVTPHLLTDGTQFQVLFKTKTPAPFQFDQLVKEPGGNVLSGIMMGPQPAKPESLEVRLRPQTLPKLTDGKIAVLSGRLGHLPTPENPVPTMHPFEVKYRFVSGGLQEISRMQPPPH